MIVRPLGFSERRLFAEHLKRLGREDRRMRFESAASDETIDRYVGGLRPVFDILIGAFDDALVLRGAAHVAFSGDVAEIGLSVEAHLRGQGTGTALLDAAIAWARIRGAKTMTSQCLSHNRWMRKHLIERGFSVETDRETSIANAPLARADVGLLTTTALRQTLSLGHYAAQAMLNAFEAVLLPPVNSVR